MSQPPPQPKYVPCACGSHDAYWHGPEDGLREYACVRCWNALRFRATGLEITGKCRDSATGRVSVTVALVDPGDLTPDDQVASIVERMHRLAADYGRE
jgi:hypothetical protein